MSNSKNNQDNRRLARDDIPDADDQQDFPLERRYPFPGRKLPTTVDWDRFGPAAVGTGPSNGRRHRRRLIPIDSETRERIIGELRERGLVD
jgi:hypothetical protein